MRIAVDVRSRDLQAQADDPDTHCVLVFVIKSWKRLAGSPHLVALCGPAAPAGRP
jgi:hypothetical protein